MSRSNPTLTNPAQRFFRWRGSTGELAYYDKEKAEEITVELPFEFLVLDQLSTVTGYNEQDQSSYWSNEVRSVVREELTVRTAKGIKQAGYYKDLADVRSKGAKYAKSVYLAYKDGEKGWVLGNFKASGAALTAWIEFTDGVIVENGKCLLTGSEAAKKGTTKYFVPTFTWEHSDPTEDEIAVELDKELQTYLNHYFSAKAEPEPLPEAPLDSVVLDDGAPIDLNDIPF